MHEACIQVGQRLAAALIAAALPSLASAQNEAILEANDAELGEVTIWKGKNGKTIKGNFVGEKDGFITVMEWETSADVRFSRANLSPETLEWFDRAKANQAGKKPESETGPYSPAAPANFAKIAPRKWDRNLIPSVSQSDYGHKASDCVPNSYAMFMLWWDELGILPTKRGRDFDDKAKWIHKELARRMGTRNNSGTRYRELTDSLYEFVSRNYAGKFTFRIRQIYDYAPENLAKFTSGTNATVLTLAIYHDDKLSGTHAVSLIDATPAGELTFNTWGETFKATMKHKGYNKRDDVDYRSTDIYELEITQPTDLPKWMKRKLVRFELDGLHWCQLHVMTPYVPVGHPTAAAP